MDHLSRCYAALPIRLIRVNAVIQTDDSNTEVNCQPHQFKAEDGVSIKATGVLADNEIDFSSGDAPYDYEPFFVTILIVKNI